MKDVFSAASRLTDPRSAHTLHIIIVLLYLDSNLQLRTATDSFRATLKHLQWAALNVKGTVKGTNRPGA